MCVDVQIYICTSRPQRVLLSLLRANVCFAHVYKHVCASITDGDKGAKAAEGGAGCCMSMLCVSTNYFARLQQVLTGRTRQPKNRQVERKVPAG